MRAATRWPVGAGAEAALIVSSAEATIISSLLFLLTGAVALAAPEPLSLDLKGVGADHAAAAVARSTRTSVLVLDRGQPVTLDRQAKDPTEALAAIAEQSGLSLLIVPTSTGEVFVLTSRAVSNDALQVQAKKAGKSISIERIGAEAPVVVEALREADGKARWDGGPGYLTAVLYDQPAAEVARLLRGLGQAGEALSQKPISCMERLPSVEVPCVPIDQLGLWGLVDGRRPVAIVRQGANAALAEDSDVLGQQLISQDTAARWTLSLDGDRPILRLLTIQTRTLAVGGAVPSLCEHGEDTRLLCSLDDGEILSVCKGESGTSVRIGLSTADRWYWFATHDTDGTVMTMTIGDEQAEIAVSGHVNKAKVRGRRVAGGETAWSVQDNSGTLACREVYVDDFLP